MKKIMSLLFLFLSFKTWSQDSLRKSQLLSCFDPIKDKTLIDQVLTHHLNDKWVLKVRNLNYDRSRMYSLFKDEPHFTLKGVLEKEEVELVETFDPDFPNEGPIHVEKKIYVTTDTKFINLELGDSKTLNKKEVLPNINSFVIPLKKLAKTFDKNHVSLIYFYLMENTTVILTEYNISTFMIFPIQICDQLKRYVKKQPSKFREQLKLEDAYMNPITNINLDYEFFILPNGHRLLPK